MTDGDQQGEIIKAIAQAVGLLLRSRGFSPLGGRSWRRVHGDAVQAVILDHRRVGAHPYHIEILIDLASTGGLERENVRSFGVAIEFSRIVADREGLLSALDPGSRFGSVESRMGRIERDFRSTALPILDEIEDGASLKRVKSRYPSQNDMTIVKRMQDYLDLEPR
jgi:hypothetical protein